MGFDSLATLASVCSLIADCPHSTPVWTDSGHLVIRNQNIKGGRLDLSSKSFTDTEHFQNRIRRAKPQFGDLIITREAPMGEVCMVPNGVECCLGQRQVLLRPNPSMISPLFLLYVIQSAVVQNQIAWNEGTGSTVSNIRIPVLEAIKIPHPPLPIQEEVAETLGALDDKIALLRETNATLEAIAQALFKSWFVDFDPVRAKAEGRDPDGVPPEVADLFPSEFEDSELGAIPKGWTIGTIGEIAQVIDCLHSKKPDRKESGFTFLQLANILDNGLMDFSDRYYISDDDYKRWVSRMEALPGDCVITNVGRVGAVAQIPKGERAAMGRNMTGVRPRPDFPYPTFLLECFLSGAMRQEIKRLTDVGTILDALNVRSIPSLRFFMADRTVITAYENAARPLRNRMEHNSAEMASLSSTRDTLLPRLMSGKLRIQNVENKSRLQS